jgi:hypothetical protein
VTIPDDAQSNGLTGAGGFAPAAVLPEHLAEEVLAALREADIAAYVQPTGTSPGFSLDFHQVTGPGVRLFVARPDLELARDLLVRFAADTAPEAPAAPVGPVDDDAWAELVAAFDASPDGPATAPAAPPPAGDSGWDDIRDRLGEQPEVEPVYAEDTDHYVPPPPPPLPSTDGIGKAAWAGVLGVPVVLVLALVLDWDLAGWPALLLVGGFLGGFATLLWRMGDRLPVDDGPDDGAVV